MPPLTTDELDTLNVKLVKGVSNIMETPTFSFTISFIKMTWTSNGQALILFPDYYRADLGDTISCHLSGPVT